MAGLRLEMGLLAGLGGEESGGSGSGGDVPEETGSGGASAAGRSRAGAGGLGKTPPTRQKQRKSFSEYTAELEAALDERVAAAGVVREELARWRQAQAQQQK